MCLRFTSFCFHDVCLSILLLKLHLFLSLSLLVCFVAQHLIAVFCGLVSIPVYNQSSLCLSLPSEVTIYYTDSINTLFIYILFHPCSSLIQLFTNPRIDQWSAMFMEREGRKARQREKESKEKEGKKVRKTSLLILCYVFSTHTFSLPFFFYLILHFLFVILVLVTNYSCIRNANNASLHI